ncbi:hypothetical protein KP509_1Z027600 [Ceratopteris richardii]|nr:hypothetical protein KP509_1Z027600 [Ceratopteris richardii]
MKDLQSTAIDKLPLLPNFFELIGFLYSTWFAYQNFLFKSDRDNLHEKVDAILRSIIDFENPEDKLRKRVYAIFRCGGYDIAVILSSKFCIVIPFVL